MSSLPAQLELPIRSEWESIEPLCSAVVGFLLGGVGLPGDKAQLMGMAVHELLENALKYGDWQSGGAPRAYLRVAVEEGHVVLEVCHGVAEGSEVVKRLRERLEQIRAAPSPEAAYVQRMIEAAQDPSSVGGLGLARVAFESDCELTLEVHGDTLLVLRARTRAPIPQGGASAAG